MSKAIEILNDASVVISGEAGQGIETAEQFLTGMFKNCGYYTFSTKEYMSRIRGGTNSSSIRVSSSPVSSYVEKIDIFVLLDEKAIKHNEYRFSEGTVRFSAKKNTYAIGLIAGIFSIEFKIVEQGIKEAFSNKPEAIINANLEAAKQGYDEGAGSNIKVNITTNNEVKNNILINCTEATAMGCIAGGCNFISSYPMSPGTGVLTYLTKKSAEFGIISDQAEDEIAAINAGIAAWFAGARGMVTTSGGGFALMTEGISLAGIIESPIVVHIAQRPGPGTGLPTRTEQGDLNLALYAGHGEFPRIILTPGDPEEAFTLAQKAFNLADKYQVPVFILTDQYMLDSLFSIKGLDIDSTEIENYVVKTGPAYKRYKLSDLGISPRGIPGYGEGLVLADSDEHTEEGHITEDLDLRVKMNDKRLKKFDMMTQEAIQPELTGPVDFKTLVITWGSAKLAVEEALKLLNSEETALLHFKQVYPLHPVIKQYLDKAQKIIIVENNATSQFGSLIKQTTGVEIRHKILKYNGLAFSTEEIVSKLKELKNSELNPV